MYKHTTKSYKSVVSDVQVYADHIFFKAMGQLGTQQTKGIGIADSNRQLYQYVKMFRNHSERDDHNTALIMLAMIRNRLYKYVADALRADVDFNISECARILNDIEEYAETARIKDAAQP